MATAPFGDQFLLANTSLYGSRISDFISRPVNYILTGFKPGYALQASELNELQEQFYLQQTLSNRCVFNWLSSTNNRVPFWNGTTPFSPGQFTASNNGSSIAFTLSAGWCYIMDKTYTSNSISVNSGMGYWCYNDTDISLSISKSAISTVSSAPTRIGLIYDTTTVNALDDGTLYDNSNSNNVLMSIPGADRILIENFSLAQFSSQTLFSDICTVLNTSGTYTINFQDGSLITTITG
jgi:hypothetical protein